MRPQPAIAFFLVALSFGLTACTLTPDYERPELDLPAEFYEPAESGQELANLPWWELFDEPALTALIEAALLNNRDLEVALYQIEEAAALLQVTRADQFPFVDFQGGAGRSRLSGELGIPGLGGRTLNNFSLSGVLFWELDLWGRLRRATEASRRDLFATESAYRSVTISLVASVATAYLTLRDLDARREISIRTLESRRESVAIIGARFDQGTVAELELNQAQIEEADAAAILAQIERSVRQTENALRVLIGENPGPIVRGRPLAELVVPPQVPAGLPSELLERRPDVVAAEQALAAETARIGVARAARVPTLTLTGAFGYESAEIKDLLTGSARSWNVFGNLFQPLINWGQLRAQEESVRARTEQALSNYEGTILNAFREVEDALIALRTLEDELAAREDQLVAASSAARLSRERYDGGFVSYLEVLDTQRSLFTAELLVSALRRQRLEAYVNLYKALGGGWNPVEPNPANAAGEPQ